MRTMSGIGRLGGLLALGVGVAISGLGCLVETSDYPGGAVCVPDLYVNWQVVDNTDAPVTCASAGAVSVAGQVGDRTDSVACPAGSSTGLPLYFPLPLAGTYDVNVQLLDGGGQILSQTGVSSSGVGVAPPSLYVDCSGNTETPSVKLSFN